MIILEVTKKEGFPIILEDRKTTGGRGGGQIDPHRIFSYKTEKLYYPVLTYLLGKKRKK